MKDVIVEHQKQKLYLAGNDTRVTDYRILRATLQTGKDHSTNLSGD